MQPSNAGVIRRLSFTESAKGSGKQNEQQVNPHCGCKLGVSNYYYEESYNVKIVKTNKIFIITLLFIINYNSVFSQFLELEHRKYYSTEEHAYYEQLANIREQAKQESDRNPNSEIILLDYVKIIKIKEPAAYNENLPVYPYFDAILHFFDSIMDKEKLDSAMQVMENDKIGIIPQLSVIKQEKLNNNWAIIYSSPFDPFDDFIFGGKGYWLALSSDNGKTWDKYYTGLSENFPYCLKQQSNIPLWKNEDTLQIECVMTHRKGEVTHPMPAEFVLVKDSIAVQLSIKKIANDSDKDGLTDIIERKMLLDPENPDSDGDGILDPQDKNPRYRSVNNEKTRIYNAILNDTPFLFKGSIAIDLANPPAIGQIESDTLEIDSKTISVFVTDQQDLLGLNPTNETLIILSSKDYEDYVLRYPSHSIKRQLSPMFKCDKIRNAYKIQESRFTGGTMYLIKKTRKGWKITPIYEWVS